MTVLAVVGTLASGSTTFCEMLKKKGFETISLSDILREQVRSEGKELTRENLRAKGDELRRRHGKAALAILAWDRIKGKGSWIIESVMVTEEMEFLKSKGAKSVAVTAPEALRYERAVSRGRDKFKTFEEFLEADRKDRELGLDGMIDGADIVISNDGTSGELEEIADLIAKNFQ
jgi:dephospho-CoA kinase